METRHERHHHRSGPQPSRTLGVDQPPPRRLERGANGSAPHGERLQLNLQAGNLLNTGTLSGPTPDAVCSLIELTAGGKSPAHLPNGEVRTWVKDSDAITLSGWCEKPGVARIGFGECTARVLPARSS